MIKGYIQTEEKIKCLQSKFLTSNLKGYNNIIVASDLNTIKYLQILQAQN